MCECPHVIPVDHFPCHKNLIGMIKNYLVINHNCEVTAEKVIKTAHENGAVYDLENEKEEVIEYFFILFGAPGEIPHGYTEKELINLFCTNDQETESFNFDEFSDHEPLKPGQQCPACQNTGNRVVDGDVVPCELCLRSGRQY